MTAAPMRLARVDLLCAPHARCAERWGSRVLDEVEAPLPAACAPLAVEVPRPVWRGRGPSRCVAPSDAGSELVLESHPRGRCLEFGCGRLAWGATFATCRSSGLAWCLSPVEVDDVLRCAWCPAPASARVEVLLVVDAAVETPAPVDDLDVRLAGGAR